MDKTKGRGLESEEGGGAAGVGRNGGEERQTTVLEQQ